MRLGATPSQTVGPYFKIGLMRLCNHNLVKSGVPGERITIEGRVLDANGTPIPDAVLEIWQADNTGQYCDPEDADALFAGFGRIPTDALGEFRFQTIKPGPVVDPTVGKQAPHINVTVLMRGLLRHLVTRIYFAGEASNASDPILALVPEPRRETLMAKPASAGSSTLKWDVIMHGDGETVFFDW